MPKVLISDHAEDVGGVIVEPGQPLPDNVDGAVLERLEADGKLADKPAAKEKGAK